MWKKWFAWYPVRLLTMEWAWLRWVDRRRPGQAGEWSFLGNDYANPGWVKEIQREAIAHLEDALADPEGRKRRS